MNVLPSRRTILAVVGLAVVLSTVVSAHGSFATLLLLEQDQQAAEGVTEKYKVTVQAGGEDTVPPPYRNETPSVDLRVRYDGEVIDQRQFELGYLKQESFFASHTPSEPGNHTVTVNTTFSLGGGEWQTKSNSSRTIEVVPAGSSAALEECKQKSGGLLSTGTVQCHLDNQGIAGLLPGLLGSPVLALLVILVLGGLGVAGLSLFGVELFELGDLL